MKFTKGHIINTIRCTIRHKIMYCILFRGGDLNRFKVLPDLGGSGPPRCSWPTYIFYLVSLDARNKNIYVFSLRVGISTVFKISDHFLFQGNQDQPRGLWPTYQLMCHHARNKNIHCLGNRIPIVFRDIWSFPIPGGRMTSGAIYYFP